MKYTKPELKSLGSLSGLTLGMNGSSLDGNAMNISQLGGGNDGTGPVVNPPMMP